MPNEDSLPGIILYADYEEKFAMLPDEDKSGLIMAMFAYNRTGAVPEGLSPLVQFALSFIKGDIDRNREKYTDTCKRNRENGKKGGRPQKQVSEETHDNPVGFLGFSENPPVFSETHNNPEKPKEKYKEKDKENPKESESVKEKEKATVPAFRTAEGTATQAWDTPHTPTQEGTEISLQGTPSLEQVRAYCREIQSTVDPQTFYDHYSSTGWKANNAPIADWQAKLRYWDAKDRQEGKTTAAVNTPGYNKTRANDPLAEVEHLITRID